MAFGLLNRARVSRREQVVRRRARAVVTAGATVGIAFLSFARKVDTLPDAGFDYDRSRRARCCPRSSRGARPPRRPPPGDRIVLADGQTAASLAQPERSLARKPFPHHLVVVSGGEIRERALGEPSVRFDCTYLFLAFVGFLYLSSASSRSRASAPRRRASSGRCASPPSRSTS